MKFFRFRHTLTIMLTATFLGGCNDTSVSGDESGLSPMDFKATTSPVSRAITTNEAFLKEGNVFNVWGSYKSDTEPAFKPTQVFNGTDVTYNGANWTYDEPRYWLPNFLYDFRAIHPKGLAGKVRYSIGENSNETPSFSLTDYDVEAQQDILYAASGTIKAVSGPMHAVNLKFNHLLSRVVIIGRSDANDYHTGGGVIITSARLYGIHTVGDWNSMVNAGNVSAGSWTPVGEVIGEQSDAYLYTSNEVLPAEGISIFGDKILFLPQELTANAVLKIDYTIRNSSAQPSTVIFKFSDYTAKWDAGKSYQYSFTVSDNITFEIPKVEPWEEDPVGNDNNFNIYN